MSKEIIGYIKNIQPDELGLNGNSSEKISHLLSVTERLINDKPKKPVDAVFFFGRSYFDAEKQGLFKLAVDYIQQGGAKYIIIPGTEGERQGETTPRIANPGKTLCTDTLVKMGVPHEYVIHSAPGYNSKTEGDAFLAKGREMNWTRVVAIANPHQIVRATLGLVKSVKDRSLNIAVYSDVPSETNWDRRVKGSQGKELKPRFKHVTDEVERIFNYQDKGDLAGFQELFDYLDRRDGVRN